VDKLELGLPFADAIERELIQCDVLIALIGREWLGARDENGALRLHDPDDYVRREISTALEREIRVIPVLAEGVPMPRADQLPEVLRHLVGRHAFEMGYGTRWRYDREILLTALDRLASGKARGARARDDDEASLPGPSVPASERTSIKPQAPRGSRRLVWTRKKALLVCGAALALATAAAVAAFVATSGSGTSERADDMYPDSIDSELLLAHVPESIRMTCGEAKVADADVFLRSVRCATGFGGSVAYSRAHSGAALRADFLRRVKAAGISFPTKRSCQAGRPAADEWSRNGVQTHVERGDRRAEGRVLCFLDAGRSSIIWTDTPTKILAVASAPVQFDVLYGWWRTRAGPEKELAMAGPMSKLRRYPDAIEQELLLSHIPASIKPCSRTEDFDENVFLRAVTCMEHAGGGSVQYSYAHSGTALTGYAENRATAAGIDFPTAESCRTSAFAADTWMRVGAIGHRETGSPHEGDGRVICFENSGTASIEWTDVPTGIYASASRPSGQRSMLYTWWQEKAGPGALEGDSGMHMGG
jgi:hypothetical protein